MEPIYRFGSFRLDPVSRRLTRDGIAVKVTPKMLDVLLLLVRNAGNVVTRDEILREVWPDTVVSDSNVSVHISKLRSALGETAQDWRFIETVARSGYRFCHGVRAEFPQSGNVPNEEDQDALREAVGFGVAHRARPHPRVAVLPFRIIAGDDYIADGITESLIANLAQVSGLKIISRTSVMRYREHHASLPKIAQELGVSYAVEGSVFQTSDRVRITAQLVRTADDEPVWTQQYDREMRDLLQFQNEVTVAISREVGVRLTADERSRLSASPVPSDSIVYRQYLRGRYLRNKNTPEDFRRAIKHLEQAVEDDPSFAPPYSLLAQSHFMLWLFGAIPRDVAARRVRRFVDEALQQDARLPGTHISLGLQHEFFDWDWAAAEAAFREAIRLAPGSSTAHQEYGAFLGRMGRPVQAQAEIARARSLDPLSANTQTLAAETLYYEGRYDEAAAECRNALELDSRYVWARVLLGWSLLQSGSKREAVDTLSGAVALSGRSPFALGSLGHAYAVTGDRPAAEEILNQLEQRGDSSIDVSVFAALIELGLSRKSKAFDWLDRACKRRSAWILLARADPRFQKLRDEPRYIGLLRRIGFDPTRRT